MDRLIVLFDVMLIVILGGGAVYGAWFFVGHSLLYFDHLSEKISSNALEHSFILFMLLSAVLAVVARMYLFLQKFFQQWLAKSELVRSIITKVRNVGEKEVSARYSAVQELEPSKEMIGRALDEALSALLKKDNYILRIDVNERAISHRLAEYLEPYFSDWNVDCEYNRSHDDPKRLIIPGRTVQNDDTQARAVFPDIIVHKRQTDKNLLVIEMKKTTSSETDEFDHHKLNAFKTQLGYTYAVFVKVRTNTKYPEIEKIEWI